MCPNIKCFDIIKMGNIHCIYRLNILIVGCHGHQLHLYIYGVFPVAKVTIGEQNGSEVHMFISPDWPLSLDWL